MTLFIKDGDMVVEVIEMKPVERQELVDKVEAQQEKLKAAEYKLAEYDDLMIDDATHVDPPLPTESEPEQDSVAPDNTSVAPTEPAPEPTVEQLPTPVITEITSVPVDTPVTDSPAAPEAPVLDPTQIPVSIQ